MLPTTRVKTLHLLASLCLSDQSEEIEKCLRVATRILDKLDPEDPLIKPLQETNEHMVSMMEIWHTEHDGAGKGMEGVDYEGKFVCLTDEKSDGGQDGGKARKKLKLKLKWFRAAFKRKPRMTS
jgi:inorganic pyrophosphatase